MCMMVKRIKYLCSVFALAPNDSKELNGILGTFESKTFKRYGLKNNLTNKEYITYDSQ